MLAFSIDYYGIFFRATQSVELFCTYIESSNGAKASAILYSLVETAKANMINTFEYFNLLLTEIPQHMDDKDLRFIDDLLPWSPRVQKECPSRYKKS